MARNLSKKTRRQIKARKLAESGTIVATSDSSLQSLLGIILRRLWLYSGSLPAYQAASLIEQGQPLAVDREGFTHYYR